MIDIKIRRTTDTDTWLIYDVFCVVSPRDFFANVLPPASGLYCRLEHRWPQDPFPAADRGCHTALHRHNKSVASTADPNHRLSSSALLAPPSLLHITAHYHLTDRRPRPSLYGQRTLENYPRIKPNPKLIYAAAACLVRCLRPPMSTSARRTTSHLPCCPPASLTEGIKEEDVIHWFYCCKCINLICGFWWIDDDEYK